MSSAAQSNAKEMEADKQKSLSTKEASVCRLIHEYRRVLAGDQNYISVVSVDAQMAHARTLVAPEKWPEEWECPTDVREAFVDAKHPLVARITDNNPFLLDKLFPDGASIYRDPRRAVYDTWNRFFGTRPKKMSWRDMDSTDRVSEYLLKQTDAWLHPRIVAGGQFPLGPKLSHNGFMSMLKSVRSTLGVGTSQITFDIGHGQVFKVCYRNSNGDNRGPSEQSRLIGMHQLFDGVIGTSGRKRVGSIKGLCMPIVEPKDDGPTPAQIRTLIPKAKWASEIEALASLDSGRSLTASYESFLEELHGWQWGITLDTKKFMLYDFD
jgi:hypothetical protein